MPARGLSGHLQRGADEPGSLFVSISRDGDGRAPVGQATLIASLFTPTADWCTLEEEAYQQRKRARFEAMQAALSAWFDLKPEHWLHAELATPRGFAGWTGRPRGMVGGLGQHLSRFGPFGLAGRTPLQGLWLCGDSLHPGEGTAGVSLSALNVCRQLLAERGNELQLKLTVVSRYSGRNAWVRLSSRCSCSQFPRSTASSNCSRLQR